MNSRERGKPRGGGGVRRTGSQIERDDAAAASAGAGDAATI